MDDETKLSDSDWLKLQRLENDHRRWFWTRVKAFGGWIAGAGTFVGAVTGGLWAGIDAFQKLAEWLARK